MSKLTITVMALTAIATGAIEAARAVTHAGARAGLGGRVKGINAAEAATGDSITVQRDGVFPWESGAAVAVGDLLVPDALGRCVPLKFTPTAITAITEANPGVVTAAGHGLHTGETVFIHSVGGMVELNGRQFTVTVVDEDTFSLNGEDTSGHTSFTSGGFAVLVPPPNVFAEALEAASDAGELPLVTRK